MRATVWKPEYTARAEEFWREYQERINLSELAGQVAAIDPVTGLAVNEPDASEWEALGSFWHGWRPQLDGAFSDEQRSYGR